VKGAADGHEILELQALSTAVKSRYGRGVQLTILEAQTCQSSACWKGGTSVRNPRQFLVKAFNGVVADLGVRTVADRKRAAKIVIELAASQTVLDVEWLRDEAAGLMRNELALSVK
jgi:hypothetical protein